MSTAKETLEKIAKAIGIATEEPTVETVEETVEATEEPAEALEEKVEDTVETVEAPEPKEDKRVEELETQINELKEILKNALESNKDEAPVIEAPVVEEKGLTHSPEAEVKVKQKKLGNKGGDIMSNVFKYINN